MSNIDYIIHLCHDMTEQGKTPSVALVRKMSPHPLSIPEVIKALQHYKSNPDVRPKSTNTQKSQAQTPSQSLEQRVTQLENQVATLLKQLNKTS